MIEIYCNYIRKPLLLTSLPMTPFMMFLVFWIEVLVSRATLFFPASGICLLGRWEGQKFGEGCSQNLDELGKWEASTIHEIKQVVSLLHRAKKASEILRNSQKPMCVVGIATFRTPLMPCCCIGAMTSEDGRWCEGWSFFCGASEWLFDSVMLLSSMFIL